MIFPSRITGVFPATKTFKLQRPSHLQTEADFESFAVAPVYPAYDPPARGFMAPSFAAQLLDMGLRYGMEDLIPHREEKPGAVFAGEALRQYEQAEENFEPLHTAFYTRFAA
jgi:hypothetical protein